MQNIGNQTVAPPQQRIAPVNAAVQIQAHHSQSVNPISAQQQPNTNEPSSGTEIPFPNKFAFIN